MCDLVEKIVETKWNCLSDDHENKLFIKNEEYDPEASFKFLAEVDASFRLKYLQCFIEAWQNFLERRGGLIKYNNLILAAKELIFDYFDRDQILIRELDEGTFGFNKLLTNPPQILRMDPEKCLQDTLKIYEALLPEEKTIKIFLTNDINDDENEFHAMKPKLRRSLILECDPSKKFKKIRGITVEQKSHRIKNNRTKIHYNYNDLDISAHVDESASAILAHQIPENQYGCKTFNISWKNNSIKIRPGVNFKKKKNFNI
jgi:hypothetical protein